MLAAAVVGSLAVAGGMQSGRVQSGSKIDKEQKISAVDVNMKSDKSNSIDKKDKISVLPNFHSLLLVCGIFCAHVLHIGTASEMNHVDLSDDMFKLLAVAVVGSLAVAVVMKSGRVQPCSSIDKKQKNSVVDMHMKSDKSNSIDKKDKISVLPNFQSLLLVCGIFCVHVLHNVRESGILGTASVIESGIDTSCVSKHGSVFPFCLPDMNLVNHPDGMIEMLAVAVVGALVGAVVMQSCRVQSCNNVDKKQKISVLPNFHSLLLVCGIFSVHVVHNVQNDNSILGTANVLLSGGIVNMMPIIGFLVVSLVVGALWMQSGSTSKTEKVSVLPNPYSAVLICCVLCAHVVYNLPEDILGTASVLLSEGIVNMMPIMGFLVVSLVVGALWMQSSSTSKTKKVSVLPNSYSVMLVCCVLCAHVVHNRPENTNIGSPEAGVGTILGQVSAIRSFGEKDQNAEDMPAILRKITLKDNAEDMPAILRKITLKDSILEKEQTALGSIVAKRSVEAGSTSSDAYDARHSEVVSKTSPKAIFASVLLAFIAMTLKMGAKNNDKKAKPSVLPNSRSILLICCLFFGHVVHNWPSTYSEHNSQVSVYTGVDEVASWDEYGSVLPDTAEDLDNLLEASPDMLTVR